MNILYAFKFYQSLKLDRQKKPHEKTDNFDNEDWNKSLVLNVL